jgi:arsenite methyltransferase
MDMSQNRAENLREGVRRAYSAAADDPHGKHPFPVGRRFAESLGYPGDFLDALPPESVDAFSGVSNVALMADIAAGARVLDVGCGAGLDSLIAAERVGPLGQVIGVDFSESMIGRARRAAHEIQANNVGFCVGDAERLPLPDGSVSLALANGIFNLNPARQAIFRELSRVIARGGRVFVSELILKDPLPEEDQGSEGNWFA